MPEIKYTLTILDPLDLTKWLTQRDQTFGDWSQIEGQIRTDKEQFYDRSFLPIKYHAFDGTTELTGSFGV